MTRVEATDRTINSENRIVEQRDSEATNMEARYEEFVEDDLLQVQDFAQSWTSDAIRIVIRSYEQALRDGQNPFNAASTLAAMYNYQSKVQNMVMKEIADYRPPSASSLV